MNRGKIPFLLIYTRILIGIFIPFLIFLQFDNGIVIASLILLGLLTDVFDGIVARKLGVASEKLRVWDSNVDVFFWISVIMSVFYLRFSIMENLLLQIFIIVGLEALAYLISFMKFKRTIATHSYMAKFWTLTLLVFILELVLNASSFSFNFCLWIGIISRIEIILIILLLKDWTTDVSSVFVVNK